MRIKFIELFLAVLCVIALVNAAYAKTYTAKDIERLKAFADAGAPDAMNKLGVFYMDGNKFFHRDIHKAVAYYKKAAGLDNIPAMSNLGAIYNGGHTKEGVYPDYEKSIKLIRKAIKEGYIPPYINLGYAYNDGLGVLKNLNLAEKYYKIAAEANIPLAQFDLAYFYLHSFNTKDKEAYFWYQKAAKNGHVNAYSYIATFYFVGDVVKKDLPKAYMYARYGELIGAQGADNTLKKFILPKITPTEKAQGEKLLKDYIANHPIPVKN